MRKASLTAVVFFLAQCVWAGIVQVNFECVFASQQLKPGYTYYHSQTEDSIRIDVCRFYVSNIKFMRDERVVFDGGNAVYLIDASDSNSYLLKFTLPDTVQWNELKFSLGTDSVTNTSGALGGSLDPANGMYWAWQSGYINLKLEGRSAKCTARKNLFQYHLGGYAYPHNTIREVKISCVQRERVTILFEADRFFEIVNVKETAAIMSPGEAAAALCSKTAVFFSIKP